LTLHKKTYDKARDAVLAIGTLFEDTLLPSFPLLPSESLLMVDLELLLLLLLLADGKNVDGRWLSEDVDSKGRPVEESAGRT
jgi:hypothetical protein